MFEKLKKNKTVRSLLTAAAVFSAGAPAVAGTPSKPATKTVQTAPNPARGRLDLIQMYRPVCVALEKDLCYCYDDKGVPACGSGVRFCYYPELKDVEGIKLTIRRGCVLDLTDTAYLKQMADANWKHPKTAPLFPVVLKAEKVKLKDVTGGMPTGSQKKLVGGELVVIPSGTVHSPEASIHSPLDVSTSMR